MKTKLLLFFAVISLLLSACAASDGLIGHSINTEVQLSKNNYKIISSVRGEASGSALFGIGINMKNLVQRAKQDMIEKADLIGKPRALINVTTDVNTKFALVWWKTTVTVSAEVIEFTN